ncbi:IclR family transcriptional regulator domain-containing protein [Leucobacter aridicollis]
MRLLEKALDGTLRVGSAYFALGASRHDAWLREARIGLRRLASSERTSVRVLAADGPRAVLLRFESGHGAPDAAVRPGMVTPIWSTGGGRALLWHRERTEILDLLAASSFIGVGGPNASRSPADVVDRLEQDRGTGYIEAVEEFEYGVVEIAAPVLVEGDAVAAVSAACHSTDTQARARLRTEVPRLAMHLGSIAGRPVVPAD